MKTILLSKLPKRGRRTNGIDGYEDNPAMQKGDIPDNNVLDVQFQELQKTLGTISNLELLEFPYGSGLYDFVFIRDSFISNQKDKIILSRFHEKKRSEEVNYMRLQLESLIERKDLGYNIIDTTLSDIYIEGGEFRYLPKQNLLIVGQGRNTQSGIEFVMKTFGIPEQNCIVLHGKGFHVDVYCSVVTDKEGVLRYIIVCEDIVLPDEIKKLELFAESHGAELLTVPAYYGIGLDGKGMLATNTLNINNYLIGCNLFPEEVEQKIKAIGVQRSIVNVSEYMKSGGAIHCLTNVL